LLLVERVLGDRRPVSHVAKELGISGYSGKKKAELIDLLRSH